MDDGVMICNPSALIFNIPVISNYDSDMTVVAEYTVIQTAEMFQDLAAIILHFIN